MDDPESKKRADPPTQATGRRSRELTLVAAGVALGFGGATLLGEPETSGPSRSAAEVERAVERATAEVGAFDRAHALAEALAALDASNVAGAVRAMRRDAGHLDPSTAQIFLSAWVEFAPGDAFAEAESWSPSASREMGMRTVLREWAASGRWLEATDFFQTIPDAETRSALIGALARGWALSGDIEGALSLARSAWDRGENGEQAVDGFVRGALAVEGAVATANRLIELDFAKPRSGFEQRLILAGLKLVSQEQPSEAARAYSGVYAASGPTDWLDGQMRELAAVWAAIDPPGTLAWLRGEPDRPERTLALKETMRAWMLQDMDTAWTWWLDEVARGEALGSEPPELRRILLAPALRTLARVRPAEASEWLEAVGIEANRAPLVLRIAHFWSLEDPVAATAWVDDLQLDADQRSRAREIIERHSSTGGPESAKAAAN